MQSCIQNDNKAARRKRLTTPLFPLNKGGLYHNSPLIKGDRGLYVEELTTKPTQLAVESDFA